MSIADKAQEIALKNLEEALLELISSAEADAELKALADSLISKLPASVQAMVAAYEGAALLALKGILLKGAGMVSDKV